MPTPRKPIEPRLPRSLGRKAVADLGLAIVSGDFPPESVLPNEDALAEQLGIGRSVVREAIKVLSGKGLIRTARRYGSRVCPRDEWNYLDPDVLGWHLSDPANLPQFLRDIGEFRLLLEPTATFLAARRATRSEIARIVALSEPLNGQRTAKTIEIDIEFHLSVMRASHNLLLAGLCPAMEVLLRAYFVTMWKLRGPESADQLRDNRHLQMSRRIEAGDGDGARIILTEMLQSSRSEIENVLATLPQGRVAIPVDSPDFARLATEVSAAFGL